MVKYSQNDPRWKYDKMGQSNATLGRYGCTTTCVSTLGTWFNENITPKELAQRLEYTKSGLLYWKSIDKVYKRMKFKWRFYSFDKALIDEALIKNPDTVVLLNVDRGYHWVSAFGKTLGMYRCSDPYPFPSRERLYKPSDIVGGAILTRA